MHYMPSMKNVRILTALFVCLISSNLSLLAGGGGGHGGAVIEDFPLPLSHYEAMEQKQSAELGRELSLVEILQNRVQEDPFYLIATIIFFCAIAHTFFAGKFMALAHKYEHEHEEQQKGKESFFVDGKKPISIKATLFHFLGEIEAIFGIWLIPLIAAILATKGWDHVLHYIDTRVYTEPVFVVIIMAIASTRPIIKMAEVLLKGVASIGKGSPAAWWLSILTIAPVLGSFITEPAAMTIAAILLGQQFYVLKPKAIFCYATLGLLFVNISVGGTLTHFAAPPVLMVAGPWGWDIVFMLTHFGWKAVLGIIAANVLYFAIFRKNFTVLKEKAVEMAKEGVGPLAQNKREEPVPIWIIVVHLLFLAWTVFVLHHPPMVIGGFLFFLAFTMATDHHQYQIGLKGPILVGFFLAGLVTHGGFQGWWIAPVLGSLSEIPLFLGSTLLTAFNDNAAITFLASQVPAFSPYEVVDGVQVLKSGVEMEVAKSLEYAVVAGAVTGGGLTVIANAPNPAGQSLLSKYFEGGVSPVKLLLGALAPTVIMAIVFIVLPH